ncbi:Putative aminopeptidase [hydrothermal vent metagenome]|uniref:Aminopeptidase n=1 Tax=hydrothermal vent metagenome TaxID=652676 RepID=A0A3B1DM83_9ZZZZ
MKKCVLWISTVACTALLFVPAFGAKVFTPTESRLRDDIKYLASDELEGRGVGSKGLNAAADFIKEEFRKAGLNVTSVKGDAFQKLTITTGAKLGKPNSLLLVSPTGFPILRTINLEQGTDFTVCSFGGSGKVSGDIVFVGYGIQSKKQKYNDFEGIDVKGKTVIIMRRVPQQGQKKGIFGGQHGAMSIHASLRSKVKNAMSKGASAILFVNDPFSGRNDLKMAKMQVEKRHKNIDKIEQQLKQIKNQEQVAKLNKQLQTAKERLVNSEKGLKELNQDPLMKFGYGGRRRGKSIPIFHITRKFCNQLLQASLGKKLEDLESAIDKNLKPQSAFLKECQITGVTTVQTDKAEIKNVIGVIEGEGPLADETVIIGAHYDHVGFGLRGSLAPGSKAVHNGADDNASGTVSLLELARRIGAMKKKPARRIVFIAFSGEERGLLGSAYYAKNPIFPLKKTIAMLNMDMVGRLRNNKLTVFGIGTSPHWKALIETEAKEHHLKTALKPEGFGPSDQSSFYAKKIPVLHFFTGAHKDYHRPGDDWEKINIEGMGRVVGMIEDVLLDTVEKKERPKYIAIKKRARIGRNGSRPYFGVIPDFGSDEVKGCSISGVGPGSPAEKGKLKAGDVITQLGKHKIENLSDFDLALRKFKAGDDVDVTVLRKGKATKLTVTLAKPR